MFLFELHLYNSVTNMVEHRVYNYYSICVLILYVTLQKAFYLTWYIISVLNVSLEWMQSNLFTFRLQIKPKNEINDEPLNCFIGLPYQEQGFWSRSAHIVHHARPDSL